MNEEKSLYLVTFEDLENPFLIRSSNEEEAKEVYILNLKADESFIENVYDKAINFGFVEKFWNPLLDYECSMSLEEQIENYDLEPKFIENVKKYFGEKEHYAELFLKYYFSDQYYPDCGDLFPYEMIKLLWQNELRSDTYVNFIIIKLNDLPYFEKRIPNVIPVVIECKL